MVACDDSNSRNYFLEMDFPSSPDDIRAVFFNNLSDFHLQKMLVEDSKFAEVGCQKSMEIKCVLEGQTSKETKLSINRIKEAMEAGINPGVFFLTVSYDFQFWSN